MCPNQWADGQGTPGDVQSMTYDEALAYMDGLASFGMMLGLTRIEKLTEVLGHPEADLKIIHIAGTNGKGSVGAFLAAILQAAGLKVGRFISPAVFGYRERIQVDGEYISEEAFARCTAQLVQACARLEAMGIEQPTQFEMDTAMAFLYFKQMGCDYVVLEVGLGGRMDSTNVIKSSMMSVITSIGLDHTRVLGNSLEEIAGEKAGIIKPGQFVVTAPQEESVMEVLRRRCEQTGAHLVIAGTPDLAVNTSSTGNAALSAAMDDLTQAFSYKDIGHFKISMLGLYQPQNAAVALEAARVLMREYCAELTGEHMASGLINARWPGRFEIISRQPCVVADGAHNPDGARMLAASIKRWFAGRRILLLMGVFADKDYENILEIMSQCGNTIITHKPDGPRGLDAGILAARAGRLFENAVNGENLENAFKLAREMAEPGDVIVSFGSLSTLKKLYRIVGEFQ